jgi:hypothetical protein
MVMDERGFWFTPMSEEMKKRLFDHHKMAPAHLMQA